MDEQIEREYMEKQAVTKTWTIPAHCDKGPVTIELTLPEVKIADSEGRYILITPRQSDVVGSRMSDISCWLQMGDKDWVGGDE